MLFRANESWFVMMYAFMRGVPVTCVDIPALDLIVSEEF